MLEHGTDDDFDAALDGMPDGRRAFLKKLAIGTAFATPIVSSFTMTGIKAVYAQTPSVSGVGGAGANRNSSAGDSGTTTTSTTSGGPPHVQREGDPNPTTSTTTVVTNPNQR